MFADLFKSNGLKRTLAVILGLAGQVAGAVPALAPYKGAIDTAAAILGALGLGHAAASGTLLGVKK